MHFFQDIAKFHVICKHIGRFTREDVFKKQCQSGIFYLVPSLTFVGGLIVDSQSQNFTLQTLSNSAVTLIVAILDRPKFIPSITLHHKFIKTLFLVLSLALFSICNHLPTF